MTRTIAPVAGPSPRQNAVADVDPAIKEAAQDMEAMFLDYLLQVMRNTIPNNEYDLENNATKIYRGMLDSEIAKVMARTNSLGLSQQIIDSLTSSGYTDQSGITAQGGSHEGQ